MSQITGNFWKVTQDKIHKANIFKFDIIETWKKVVVNIEETFSFCRDILNTYAHFLKIGTPQNDL